MADVERQLKAEDVGLESMAQYAYGELSKSVNQYELKDIHPSARMISRESTPVQSESLGQEATFESVLFVDPTANEREWHDGYKPAKRRKIASRPGENSFRIPMTAKQRHSLGASVRPKDSQGMSVTDPSPTNGNLATTLAQDDQGAPSTTRGGTKMEFRAYNAMPTTGSLSAGKLSGNEDSKVAFLPPQTALDHNHNYHQGSFRIHPPNSMPVLSDNPDNGLKLAWWLAQQISQMGSPQSNIAHQHVAEMSTQQFYGNTELNQDKKRLTDRERKARWREANMQRNRENDLRARVNRQARLKFGEPETTGKSEWITSEISRRRNRREEKQISQAAKSGHFPLCHDSELIRNALLREDSTLVLQDSVQSFRKLAIDVLFPAQNRSDADHRVQTVQALSNALCNMTPSEHDIFQTALKIVAANDLALTAIKSTMEQFVTEEDEDVETESRPMTPGLTHSPIPEPSDHGVVTVLNKALTMLRELDELGRTNQPFSVKVLKMSNGPRKPSHREHRQHLKDFGITMSQLDNFVEFINGGDTKPDPDDEIALELFGAELDIEVPLPSDLRNTKMEEKQADLSIWEMLNSVLEMLLERCFPKPKRSRRTTKDSHNESEVHARADTIKSMLFHAGIDNSRSTTSIDSKAIREFYIRLREFKHTQSFGGDIKSAAPLPPPLQAGPVSTQRLTNSVHHAQQLPRLESTSNTPSVSHSPSSVLPLPDATNPFADDDTKASSSLGGHLSGTRSSRRITPDGNVQSQLPLASAQIGSQSVPFTSYPQFRSVNIGSSIPPDAPIPGQADQIIS